MVSLAILGLGISQPHSTDHCGHRQSSTRKKIVFIEFVADQDGFLVRAKSSAIQVGQFTADLETTWQRHRENEDIRFVTDWEHETIDLVQGITITPSGRFTQEDFNVDLNFIFSYDTLHEEDRELAKLKVSHALDYEGNRGPLGIELIGTPFQKDGVSVQFGVGYHDMTDSSEWPGDTRSVFPVQDDGVTGFIKVEIELP